MSFLRIVISSILICSLACNPKGLNLDKLANAATVLCDSVSTYDKYRPQLDMIKQLVENKEYIEAMVYAKTLYAQAQEQGDLDTANELVPLVNTLVNLAKTVPLKTQKSEPGFKTL